MVKYRYILFSLLLGMVSNEAGAQAVEYDPQLTLNVIENTAFQMGLENANNEQVERQSEIQDSIKAKALTMATILDLSQMAWTNVSGFGHESWYYKRIFNLSVDIVSTSSYIVTNCGSVKGAAAILLDVSSLIAEAENLCHTFANVVANGKIKSPLGDDSGRKDDGKNLLVRKDRLSMAIDICTRLAKVAGRLHQIERVIKYGSLRSALIRMFPDEFMLIYQSGLNKNRIINDWNRITRTVK